VVKDALSFTEYTNTIKVGCYANGYLILAICHDRNGFSRNPESSCGSDVIQGLTKSTVDHAEDLAQPFLLLANTNSLSKI
jgi:hypothetical protein